MFEMELHDWETNACNMFEGLIHLMQMEFFIYGLWQKKES